MHFLLFFYLYYFIFLFWTQQGIWSLGLSLIMSKYMSMYKSMYLYMNWVCNCISICICKKDQKTEGKPQKENKSIILILETKKELIISFINNLQIKSEKTAKNPHFVRNWTTSSIILILENKREGQILKTCILPRQAGKEHYYDINKL